MRVDDTVVLTGARILLVDDTKANLDVLGALLESEGYRIILAPSGEIALRSAAKAQPDLILLDVMMPQLDGYEVCRRLKVDPKTADIPVIFITANDQLEGLVEGFEVGGTDYIHKPFRDREVLMRVRNTLLTRHLFEQNQAYQRKMESELKTAHELQMGLMPSAPPKLDGFAVAGSCVPAEEVGGDFFQYFAQDDGTVAIALADVTGHAMAAAVPLMTFNGVLESKMELGVAPEKLLGQLNRSLHRIFAARTFACFLMAWLDPARRALHITNGGCPYPLHYRAATGEAVEIDVGNTYPLGTRADTQYPLSEIELTKGDRIVFYSDGLIETRNAAGDMFGEERLAACIAEGAKAGLHTEELRAHITCQVQHFARWRAPEDDCTIVVIECTE
jgi:sigma-B regulation protein RsbU (phosphoserine phosphatase)